MQGGIETFNTHTPRPAQSWNEKSLQKN